MHNPVERLPHRLSAGDDDGESLFPSFVMEGFESKLNPVKHFLSCTHPCQRALWRIPKED